MIVEPATAVRPQPAAAYRGLAAEPEGPHHSTASDAAVYAAGLYGAQALIALAGLIQKGLLGPVGTGYWALIQTAWTLLMISTLGAFQGAARQVPAHRGRGDLDAAAEAADTGTGFAILAIGVAGWTLGGVALVFGGGWAPELRYGLLLLGLIAPLTLFGNSHEVIFQATKRFGVSSATEVVRALVFLTVQTGAVIAFGYYGMFVGLVVATIAMLVLWNRLGLISLRRPAFRWRIERRRLGELIGFGAPIMIHGQIWFLFIAVDNLIVATFIDVRSLGYYALAVTVTSYIMLLPKGIGAAVFPRMTERFAASESIDSIRHYVVDIQRILGYMLLPLFMAGAFFLLPMLVRQVLPEFGPAIPAIRIMVAGSFFLALMNMPIKTLIAAGYRWQLTGLMALCLAVNAAANLVAVAVLDQGIEGAAVATAVSYLIAFTGVTVYAMSKAFTAREILAQLGALVAVCGYTLVTLWGLEALMGGADAPIADMLTSACKLALAILVLTPWLALAQRSFKGPQILFGLIVEGTRKLSRGAR